MSEPEQYILEEWGSMCAKAEQALRSDCPLLEDEVLVEMHKYVVALKAQQVRMREVLLLVNGSAHHDYGTGKFSVYARVMDAVEKALAQKEVSGE